MRALEKKLLRELVALGGQVVTIALVIACGVTAYVSMQSTYRALHASRSEYYAEERFADVFARLERAPNAVAARLARIEGVGQVTTRIVKEVSLDLPAISEPARGRLISVSRHDVLDHYHLRRGRDLDPSRGREVLALDAFATANHLEPGDRVALVINGRREELLIAGTVLSPEYVYPLLGGELYADDARSGVFWMDRRALEAAFGMAGAFNDVALSLSAGGSKEAVIEAVDRVLAPYGGVGAFGRDRQPSDFTITQELGQLETQATLEPAIFLFVAAFLVNVVLSRLVQTQREQIASLKALGYSGVEIGLHYAELASAIALLGALIGLGVGGYLSDRLTLLYARFFRFPLLESSLEARLVLEALLVSVASAVIGASGAVRRVVLLPPAEGMRPESPEVYTRTLLERTGLLGFVPTAFRLVSRSVEHRPLRSLTSVLGIGLGVMALVAGLFWQDSLGLLTDLQFRTAQREDLAVAFLAPKSPRAVAALRAEPGVVQAEPLRQVPARLRFRHHVRSVAVLGVPKVSELRRVIDVRGRVIVLPPEGVVVSRVLADRFEIGRGDLVTLELLEGERRPVTARVVAIAEDLIGTWVYADADALARLVHAEPLASGAVLTIDRAAEPAFLRGAQRSPAVADAARRRAILRYFEDTNAEMVLVFTAILTVFATIIAAGVTYNAARIALAERSRDLATLRVLGFTRAEVSRILLGELGVLVVLAIPVGLALGHALAGVLVEVMMDPDLLRLPAVVGLGTDLFAVLVVVASGLASGLFVRRRLDRLDLLGVLKSRD